MQNNNFSPSHPRYTDAKIISSEEIANGIFRLILDVGDETKPQPGQFAHVSVPGFTLRRPISIAGFKDGLLELIIQPVGDGTKRLTRMSKGHILSVLFPLGRPFPMDDVLSALRDNRLVWLAAGGIGLAPLLMCADAVAEAGLAVRSFVGFRDESLIFGTDRIERCGTVTRQIGGFITEPLAEALDSADTKPAMILTCGPRPFLAVMQKICCERHNVKVWASFEEAMGCGIGACLTCSCAVKKPDGDSVHHARVCRDGPVFDLKTAVFE